ncbi:PH domain-containing protein [Mucilaginibacter sp.]
MTFIEKNLANNEKIVYKAQLHWWIYGKSVLLFILGLIIVIYGSTSGFSPAAKEGVKVVGGLLILISIIGLISAYTRSSSSEFAVTNRRIMMKTGIANRRLIELQLNRSEGLVIDQGIIGRIFNYGTIIIRSGGTMEEIFSPVADPYEFKRQINNAIEGSFAPINNPSAI